MSDLPRFAITSDERGHVYISMNGEAVPGVTYAEIDLTPGNFPQIMLTLHPSVLTTDLIARLNVEIDQPPLITCIACAHDIPVESRYCSQCGKAQR